jgi:hypothetical protein
MPASHHVAFAFHHGFEAGAGGIVLLALTYFGIEHVGTRKEFGLGGARHQACDGDARVFKLRTECKRK